jgi:hypothetical protein
MAGRQLSPEAIAVLAESAGWSAEKLRTVLLAGAHASVDDLTTMIAAIETVVATKDARLSGLDKEIVAIEETLIDLVTRSTGGKIRLPHGFVPHTFETFVAAFVSKVPDIAIRLAKLANPASTDAEIGPGVETINRLQDAGLILFAERRSNGDPSFFVAAADDFTSQGDRLSADRMISYFDTSGTFDARNGDLVVDSNGRHVGDAIGGRLVTVKEWFDLSSSEIRKVQDDLRMSRRVLFEKLTDMEAKNFIALRMADGDDGVSAHILVKDASVLSPQQRAIAESLARLFGIWSRGSIDPAKQPERPGEHTYMRAIEAQFQAAADMASVLETMKRKGTMLFEGIKASDLYAFDVVALRRADTFCWFPDPTHAVEGAAASLPTSVRMTRDVTDAAFGWWYFTEPLDVSTVDVPSVGNPPVTALLWGWDTRTKSNEFGAAHDEHGVFFSAYVWSDPTSTSGVSRKGPLPTLRFFWPENVTLERALTLARLEYEAKYVTEQYGKPINAPDLMSKEKTIAGIERLARFFAAGCLWVQQRVITYAKTPVERHERKRIEKTHNLDRRLSDVQIIQLRRRESVATPSGDHRAVDWKCRWTVSGHWRSQFYPSKGRHVEKWIDAYPKGPEGKPFKTPTHRVYAVNR